jgi:hypothetical protein
MPHEPTGMQAMFPVYLAREYVQNAEADARNGSIAQNENNLNQNLATLYNKVLEIEAALATQ